MSVLFALLFVSADPAATQQPTASAPEAAAGQEAPKPIKEKKICKNKDDSSGTRMAQRICRTESQWKQGGMLGSSRSGFSVSGERN
jgi:hypothetical protein